MDDFSRYILNSFSGEQLIGKSIVHHYLRPQESFLYDLHRKEKAKFISFGESLWVESYSSLDKEYEVLSKYAGITDISMVTMVKIVGSSVLPVLQQCFSSTIPRNKSHILKYGGLISHDGRLFDDAILFIESQQEVLVTLNASFFNFQRFIENFGSVKSCEITDLTSNFGKIQLQGPKASEVLHKLFPNMPSLASFCYVNIEDGMVSASGFSRVSGYELFFPPKKTEELWLRLRGMGIQPYGISTMEVSRLEAKMICCGHEFTPYQFFPEEIGFVLSSDHSSRNMDSHMIFFYLNRNSVDVSNIPHIGEAVVDAKNEMQGIVTSFAYSPFYKSYIGFCHLLTPFSLPSKGLFLKGSPLKVENFRITPSHKVPKAL
jgi:glycine cleavage system aminomethyltransferase T